MAQKHPVKWNELDEIKGLGTDIEHEIEIQREAIPLVFIPGIMGTRLRLTGSDPSKDGADGLPNLRWDPSSSWWMAKKYAWRGADHRKKMLIGSEFSSSFLEVDNANPYADGFHGIMDAYWKKFLAPLKNHDWGPLTKVFEFPVFAIGYNWTDSAENAGRAVVNKVRQIISEATQVTGFCEKVILITHSMGGIVGRAASELAGGRGSILGVVHGVQPATGAPAAYWRMKSGFEDTGFVLGADGKEVTAVLANMPGGLQLLPNKLHRINSGTTGWLTVTQDGATLADWPKPIQDPYQEIYRIPAEPNEPAGKGATNNRYWGLVDPELLDPGNRATPKKNDTANNLDQNAPVSGSPWSQYLKQLSVAETFHDALVKKVHPQTFCLHGTGKKTADVVELQIGTYTIRREVYPDGGFRGYLRDTTGNKRATIQNPAGDGDGTVVRSSAMSLDDKKRPKPGDASAKVGHQPAYEASTVQNWAIKAIIALCQRRYEERRTKTA